jgi:hypothetical protein
MKPGEHIIWIRSPKHSILSGWRLEKIPGEIVRICRRRICIRVWMRGEERYVYVNPENLLCEAEAQIENLVADNFIPCVDPSEEGTVGDGIRRMDMKNNWFNSLENMNWTRLWWIVGILTAFWLGLVTIVPPVWFKPISVVLSSIQSALLFAARGTKYVTSRMDPPPDGKP